MGSLEAVGREVRVRLKQGEARGVGKRGGEERKIYAVKKKNNRKSLSGEGISRFFTEVGEEGSLEVPQNGAHEVQRHLLFAEIVAYSSGPISPLLQSRQKTNM
jgi:ribosomal protein L25 (general stress protein Ctc)